MVSHSSWGFSKGDKQECECTHKLSTLLRTTEGRYMVMHSIYPFRGAHLTGPQQPFNAEISKCRTCVKWGFRKLLQYLTYLEFQRNLKVLLQPVAKNYLVGILLTATLECMAHSLVPILIWRPHYWKHTYQTWYQFCCEDSFVNTCMLKMAKWKFKNTAFKICCLLS